MKKCVTCNDVTTHVFLVEAPADLRNGTKHNSGHNNDCKEPANALSPWRIYVVSHCQRLVLNPREYQDELYTSNQSAFRLSAADQPECKHVNKVSNRMQAHWPGEVQARWRTSKQPTKWIWRSTGCSTAACCQSWGECPRGNGRILQHIITFTRVAVAIDLPVSSALIFVNVLYVAHHKHRQCRCIRTALWSAHSNCHSNCPSTQTRRYRPEKH